MADETENEQPTQTFEEAQAALPTDRRRKFVIELIDCAIGAEAARRAGYAEGSAHVEASRLKKDPLVKAALDIGLREQAEESRVSRAWVAQRLKQNAVTAAEKGDIHASNRALATLAKSAGMLDKDLNVNLRGDVGASVVLYFPDNQRGPAPKGKPDDDEEKAGDG